VLVVTPLRVEMSPATPLFLLFDLCCYSPEMVTCARASICKHGLTSKIVFQSRPEHPQDHCQKVFLANSVISTIGVLLETLASEKMEKAYSCFCPYPDCGVCFIRGVCGFIDDWND